ncbi:hypothetical protein FOZ63_031429, partial [Perkinsus olseni]
AQSGAGGEDCWWPAVEELREAQEAGGENLPNGVEKGQDDLLAHEAHLHIGLPATVAVLKKYFGFPNVEKDVADALNRCPSEVCQRERQRPVKIDVSSPRRLSTAPWVLCAADITYIDRIPVLCVVDEYSRYADAQEITATNDRLVRYRGSEEDQESVYESSPSVISDLTLSEDFGSVANEQEIPQEDVHPGVEDDDNEQVLDLQLPEDFGYQQVEEAAQPEIPSRRPVRHPHEGGNPRQASLDHEGYPI